MPTAQIGRVVSVSTDDFEPVAWRDSRPGEYVGEIRIDLRGNAVVQLDIPLVSALLKAIKARSGAASGS